MEEGLKETVKKIVHFYDEYYADNGQDEIAKVIALAKMHMEYILETEQVNQFECFHCGKIFYSELQSEYSKEKCGKCLCVGCEDLYSKD